MEKTYKIQIIGCGFGGSIARIGFDIQFDPEKESIEEFRKKVVARSALSGYTAVLNFVSVNGVEEAISVFCCTHPSLNKLGLRILDEAEKAGEYQNAYDDIRKSEQMNAPANETIHFNEDMREWRYYGYTKERAWLTRCSHIGVLNGINATLEAFGLDPKEEKKTRQICENLGMFRLG